MPSCTSCFLNKPSMGNTHYSDVIMLAMASQVTCVSIVYSAVCSSADQRKHESFASLAFVRGIHRWTVNSPHKGPVMRTMFPFDVVIMKKNVTPQLTRSLVDTIRGTAPNCQPGFWGPFNCQSNCSRPDDFVYTCKQNRDIKTTMSFWRNCTEICQNARNKNSIKITTIQLRRTPYFDR